MSELAGFGIPGWLPPRVQRAMAAEDAAERREAKRVEAEREMVRDAAHDRALALYRSQAEERGEVVSALAIARGVGGRSLADVLGDAQAAADREDARQAARDRREDVYYIDQEPVIQGASRSAGPGSEYELDRQLNQASDLHRDLIAIQARAASRSGRFREHAAAVRSQATAVVTSRSSPASSYREIVRVCTDHGNVAWPS
jgi:hypothetical protein